MTVGLAKQEGQKTYTKYIFSHNTPSTLKFLDQYFSKANSNQFVP